MVGRAPSVAGNPLPAQSDALVLDATLGVPADEAGTQAQTRAHQACPVVSTVPVAERQAITSQVRAWAPEVVSRKPRPVTIPAGVRLTGPLSGPDHRHRSAPSRTLITPCRPPSSCNNHTRTACSAVEPSASRCHSPDCPGSIPLCWTPPSRPSDAASGNRAASKSCGTFVAHKSEKRCSAGSASVKEPRTKRPILSLSCGIRSHS